MIKDLSGLCLTVASERVPPSYNANAHPPKVLKRKIDISVIRTIYNTLKVKVAISLDSIILVLLPLTIALLISKQIQNFVNPTSRMSNDANSTIIAFKTRIISPKKVATKAGDA